MPKPVQKYLIASTAMLLMFSALIPVQGKDKSEDELPVESYQFEPIEQGFGSTVGNALRRTLLSSLNGSGYSTVSIPPPADPSNLNSNSLIGYITIGPEVIFPVSNTPNLIGTGAGVCFKAGTPPLIVIAEDIEGEALATIHLTGSLSLFGQTADDHSQLNQPGGVNKNVSDIFGVAFEPGVELTFPLTSRSVGLLRAGGYFNYRTADLDTVSFDNRKTQIFVNQFSDSASGTGGFVGGGVRISYGELIIDSTLNYQDYETDFLTSVNRRVDYIVWRTEFILPN